jgi:hypothetical protein
VAATTGAAGGVATATARETITAGTATAGPVSPGSTTRAAINFDGNPRRVPKPSRDGLARAKLALPHAIG